MTLRLLSHIELPPNRSNGGFDHADVHQGTDRLYVAHTSNDAVDVIDTARDRYVESIPRGVDHVDRIVAGMCDIEPIRSLMGIGVIEASVGPIWRELDMGK